MKSRLNYISWLMLLMLPCLMSCRQELCYDHFPHAAIQLSWEREWERDYGKDHRNNWDTQYHGVDYDYHRPDVPEWVNLKKYYPDGTSEDTYLSPDGGEFSISKNSGASFLLYNGDTEYIFISDIASLPEARASATSRSRSTIQTIMERHPNSRTTNPPDVLYGAFLDNIPDVENHQTTNIPIRMQPLVYTYIIRYEVEYGLHNVTMARGALGGMAESVYLRDGSTSEESIIILYDCQSTDYGFEAHVRSFGIPGFPDEYYGQRSSEEQSTERPYTLNIELLLKNGKTVSFDYDISDQIKNQPRGGVLKISGIRIEDEDAKDPVANSGFDVDVSDWGNREVIDLPVGGDAK